MGRRPVEAAKKSSTKGWKEEFIEPFWSRSNVLLDPFMNRIPVTGSIIFLHWDERKKKKKNNKSEGGGGWDYFFFFFIREKLFRKTADSKIWIKLKKKILKERNFSISKYCFQIDTILFNVCYVNGKIIFIIYSRIRYKQNIYFLIYWGTMFFFFFKYWKWIFYNFLYAFIYCIVIMLKLNILAISWNKMKRLRANSRNRNRYESWYKNMDRDLFLINDY